MTEMLWISGIIIGFVLLIGLLAYAGEVDRRRKPVELPKVPQGFLTIERSLILMTDQETGIEYLTTINGGLFPRLTRENLKKISTQMDDDVWEDLENSSMHT